MLDCVISLDVSLVRIFFSSAFSKKGNKLRASLFHTGIVMQLCIKKNIYIYVYTHISGVLISN